MAPSRFPTWLRWLTGGALILVACWLTTVGLILLAGARPNVTKADAILVLGAAQWNGKPSPVFKARLDHAIELHRLKVAPYLVVTGGIGRGDTLSEGEVALRYAVQNGVEPALILVERRGLTSAESMRAAAELMRASGLQSANIVSDSYHMLRVQLLARRAGIKPYRAPAPNSPIDRSPAERWRYILRESLLFPATAVFTGR
ncbi:MAG: YdcF family protein [Longimicrobiales bacterium]